MEFTEYNNIGIESKHKDGYTAQTDVLNYQEEIIHADIQVHKGECISYSLLNLYSGTSEYKKDVFFHCIVAIIQKK